MKIADLMTLLDYHVPFRTAESWDNVGLLIGEKKQTKKKLPKKHKTNKKKPPKPTTKPNPKP